MAMRGCDARRGICGIPEQRENVAHPETARGRSALQKIPERRETRCIPKFSERQFIAALSKNKCGARRAALRNF